MFFNAVNVGQFNFLPWFLEIVNCQVAPFFQPRVQIVTPKAWIEMVFIPLKRNAQVGQKSIRYESKEMNVFFNSEQINITFPTGVSSSSGVSWEQIFWSPVDRTVELCTIMKLWTMELLELYWVQIVKFRVFFLQNSSTS